MLPRGVVELSSCWRYGEGEAMPPVQYDLVPGSAFGVSGFGLVSGAVVKTTLTLDLVLALQTMEEL